MKKLNLRTLLFVVVAYLAFDYLGGYTVGLIPEAPATAQAQQGFPLLSSAPTQTTLSANVCGADLFTNGAFCSSVTPDTFITLASVSGLNAAINGAVQSYIYIDRELFGVLNVNTTTKQVTVLRGQWGTATHSHASGQMVLFGQANSFMSQDPSGACTTANILSSPFINVVTGQQWLCSSITLTWVPGFGNPGLSGVPTAVTAAVASAAGQVTPSGPLFHITGALAITGFLVPVGFNATANGGGSFCVIPDGTFTTTTANNIALASTAVVNREVCWQWDATNSKFVPTY